MWLRVMPAHNLGMRWTPGELQSAATQGMSMISPIGNPAGSYGYLRSNDGFGIYATLPEQGQTCLVAFAFCSGEVWTIDTITLRVRSVSELPILFLNESDFGVSLKRYSEFLSKLGVPPPYRWVSRNGRPKGAGYVSSCASWPRSLGRAARPWRRRRCGYDWILQDGGGSGDLDGAIF